MHIIFGDAVKEIPDSFTVLELDTFEIENGRTATAYCVVEKIPLSEFALINAHKELHQNLIKYYRSKQWDYCEQAIAELTGKWNGELDTFYIELLTRISKLKHASLDQNWSGVIER
jgi:hypothetical protein